MTELPYLSGGKMESMNISTISWHLIVYWVLCILLYHVGQAATQTCQKVSDSEELIFKDVRNNQSISVMRQNLDALDPLYKMQDLFLKAVQPNPFPKEMLRLIFTNTSILETSQVVKYEAGYVTCAIIAILFVLFCLIFGIIFCVFQYRGRQVLPCQGLLCEPTPIFVGLLVILCCLFVGVVFTFYLNQKAHDEMGHGIKDLPRTLQDFRQSISSIPEAIGIVVSEFEAPRKKVLADIESLHPVINRTLNNKIDKEIRPLLDTALLRIKELYAAAKFMLTMNTTLAELQDKQKSQNVEFVSLQETLLGTLSDSNCEDCTEAADFVRNVHLGYTQIPSFGGVTDMLSNLGKVNLVGIVQRAHDTLNKMPEFVNRQASKSINDVTFALDNAEEEIRFYASNLPIQKYIGPLNEAVFNLEVKAKVYGAEVERYERYRWIVGVVVCCLLLLIVTCTALGLLFGVWGFFQMRDPDSSRRRQRNGAWLLSTGVYLTFLLSWLLILFVFITFVIGGNLQTLVCKNWANGNIYKFLDDPRNLPNNIDLKKKLGLRENFTDMYNQCNRGSPVWNVLQISPIDLDKVTNITQYTGDLEKQISNFTVNVPGLNMMSDVVLKVLQQYYNGVDQIPFNSFQTQIQTAMDNLRFIESFVPALEVLTSMQSNATIRSQMENDTETLRGILNTTVRDQTTTLLKLNGNLSTLASLAPTLKVEIQQTIQDINTLKGPTIDGIIDMLRNESKCLFNRVIGYFTEYIAWLKPVVAKDIASCRSVPRTLDNARIIVCDNVSQPWNGFWFCLGWSTILLIPNVFLSIKSVQHIAPKSRSSSSKEENLFPLTQRTEAGDADPYLHVAQEGRSLQNGANVTNPYTVY